MKREILCAAAGLVLVVGCKFGGAASVAGNDPVPRDTQNAVSPLPENVPPLPSATPRKTATVSNRVCGDPGEPCEHKEKEFAEWELTFKLPAKISANKLYRSAPFYAVLLKTYESVEDCDGGEFIEAIEAERRREQSQNFLNKVFASYSCPNMDAIGYEFDGANDPKTGNTLIANFIAIYAGDTKAEADKLLQELKGRYAKGVVKKMVANYERIEQ